MNQLNPAGEVQYRVPHSSGRWSGLLLALAVHAVLFLFLWIGVRWQNNQPVAVEAEVWDMKTQAAAPAAAPEPPVAAELPEPAQEISVAAPPPVPQAAPPLATEALASKAPVIDPEIALERLKRKAKVKELAAARLKQQAAEQAAATELAKTQAKAKELAEAKAQAKAEAKAQAKAMELNAAKAQAKEFAKEQAKEQASAKLKQELLDKKQADKKLAEKVASEKKLAEKQAEKQAEKLSQAKKAAEEQKSLDQARQLEMNRITNASGSGGVGTAQKSTGARNDSGYAAAITAKIKSNIAYNGSTDVPGNPRAVYKIDQLPTGEIISVKKIKSSGIPAYDRAVENAIDKSSPLPQKKDGTVTREVEAVFDMKDLP